MTEVEAYLESLAAEDADVIRGYYERARELVPDAVDGKKYAMACLTYRDRGLIAVIRTQAGFSMFPFGSEPVALARPLLDGLTRTRGGVQFTADRLVPDAAYTLMVEWSRDHIDAARAGRR